jgi:hypothetical protein
MHFALYKYLYAYWDPVNKFNLSGQFSILGVMKVITVSATIVSITITIFHGNIIVVTIIVSIGLPCNIVFGRCLDRGDHRYWINVGIP